MSASLGYLGSCQSSRESCSHHKLPHQRSRQPGTSRLRHQKRMCRAQQASKSGVSLTRVIAVSFGVSTASLLTGLAAHADQLHPHLLPAHPPRDLYNLASNEDFWSNLVQYARFFVSVLVGTAYVAFKPLAGLLKRPGSAIGLLIGVAAFGYFIKATLTAMLGSSDSLDPFLP